MLLDQAQRVAQTDSVDSRKFEVFENENFVDSPKNTAENSAGPTQTFLDKIDLFSKGTPIVNGLPAQITSFDGDDDAIVFAYDPAVNPEPEMGLIDGAVDGEKVLTMNGNPVVYFRGSAGLRLAHINMIEVELAD